MRHAATVLLTLIAALAAAHLWAEARPGAKRLLPAAAIAANPRDSRAWIELGLERETGGGLAGAEQALLAAARWDRQYLPVWTLANFYFRRGDEAKFWEWAARAAPLIPDDPRPLLALAHAREARPIVLLERLGGGATLTRAYLDYLFGLQQFEQAHAVALALAAKHNPADDDRIADAAGRFLVAGERAAALEIWNARFPPLDPVRGPWLANADLAHRPSGSGFEASMPLCRGAAVAWDPGRLRFDFDGTQPDGCVLYDQFAAIEPGRDFRIHAEMDPVAGLTWSAASGRVKLAYHRPLGQPRARASIVLRRLVLDPQ